MADILGLDTLTTTLKNVVTNIAAMTQTLSKIFPQILATSTTATIGTNGAPPAQVQGYIAIILPDGSTGKVPFYKT